MHYNKVAYLNLKVGSIVITEVPLINPNKPKEMIGDLVVKLSDFSACNIYNRGLNERISKYTPAYVAPEIIMNKNYSTEPDIYALGILVH